MGPHRIEMNVARKLQGIGILFNQNRPVPALEEMAHPIRLCIKEVRITGVQMMKDSAKICSWGLQKQVVMIRHETEAMDSGAISFRSRFEIAEESFVISF